MRPAPGRDRTTPAEASVVPGIPGPAQGALNGLLVAVFSRVLAGPYLTMLLADLGATVILIGTVLILSILLNQLLEKRVLAGGRVSKSNRTPQIQHEPNETT